MDRNQLRIIGGQWRRRHLHFAARETLRPTTDRVRETLFNWLGQDLSGKRCADLFAGSGALAFESASRHAAYVLAVERDRVAIQWLWKNRIALGADSVDVQHTDVFALLAQSTACFDIIFADPPFQDPQWSRVLQLVAPRLVSDGLLYVESSMVPDWAGWSVYRSGRAGGVYYALLSKTTV